MSREERITYWNDMIRWDKKVISNYTGKTRDQFDWSIEYMLSEPDKTGQLFSNVFINDAESEYKWDEKIWAELNAKYSEIKESDKTVKQSQEYLVDPYKYDLKPLNKEGREILDPKLLELPVITLTIRDCIVLQDHFAVIGTNRTPHKDLGTLHDLLNMIEDIIHAAESGQLSGELDG